MEENPADPSRAATNPTIESPLLPSQPFHNGAKNGFQSSSLPHLGDFITKLIEDAYKLQSANAELERTKQLLREAEDKLASSEESKSHLSTELDRTKQQLREAEDNLKLASSEEFKSPLSTQLDRTKQQLRWAQNALKKEQKKNEKLEADNMWLNASLSNHQDLLDGTESLRIKAENKLRAVESRATILEADMRKKNDALEQKDEEVQLKIHGYKGRLGRLGSRFRKTWPIIRLLAASNFRGVEDGLIPRIFNNHDVLEEGLVLAEITREMDGEFAEFFREFRRDLCQTRASAGSSLV